MGESENAWVTQIDKWMLSDSIRTIKNVLLQEANGAFTSCLYGRQGSALTKVAAACGQFKLPRPKLVEELAEPTPIIDVDAVPAEETVGVPDMTNLKIEKNTTGGEEVQIVVNTQTYIPPTKGDEEADCHLVIYQLKRKQQIQLNAIAQLLIQKVLL